MSLPKKQLIGITKAGSFKHCLKVLSDKPKPMLRLNKPPLNNG